MGADLYIKKVFDNHNASLPKDADYEQKYSSNPGYFRDCYNGSGLFAQLGLSWWRDVGDMLDDDGILTVENAKKLHGMVKEREIEKPTVESLKAQHCKVDDGINSPEEWFKSRLKWKQELLDFLARAIEVNEPIRCSI